MLDELSKKRKIEERMLMNRLDNQINIMKKSRDPNISAVTEETEEECYNVSLDDNKIIITKKEKE